VDLPEIVLRGALRREGFDGKAKYGRLLKPGQNPADAVYLEKRREDALRAEALSVVRWGWDALTDFTDTAARLWACLRA
jgi:hypothetical protein